MLACIASIMKFPIIHEKTLAVRSSADSTKPVGIILPVKRMNDVIIHSVSDGCAIFLETKPTLNRNIKNESQYNITIILWC